MKNLKQLGTYGLLMLTAALFVLFLSVKANGQTTFQAQVGSSFAINEYAKAGASPAIGFRAGHTFVSNDATRLNIFGGYELRQLRTTALSTNNTFTINDQKIQLGAGIELGKAFRLGLNVGGQANPNKLPSRKGGDLRGENIGGFTEGLISFSRGDNIGSKASTTAGISIRAERALKAPTYFPETQVGKNTGVVTTSFFMRRNFGGRVKKQKMDYGNNLNFSPLNSVRITSADSVVFSKLLIAPAAVTIEDLFPQYRDRLLKDSVFGQSVIRLIVQISQNQGKRSLDSAVRYTDLSVAQTHSRIMADVATQPQPKYKAYSNVMPVFYNNGVATLNANQKLAIGQRLRTADLKTKFVISAFSTDVGGLSFNQGLAQARADNVCSYLKSLGFTEEPEVRLFPSQSANDGNRQTLIQW